MMGLHNCGSENKMRTVFIVDDEFNIVSLISHLIEWDKLHLKLAGTATDSLIALEQINQLKPDILIADVNMPELNGIELIERLQQTLPNLYTIIISGYQDFNYAYQAIKYGVKDYLLKPINRAELNKALEDIAIGNSAENQNESQSYIEELENKIRNSSVKLRKQYIHNLGLNSPQAAANISIAEVNDSYSFHFENGLFATGVLKLDKEEYTVGLSNSIFVKMELKGREILDPLCIDWECSGHNSELYFLFNYLKERKDEFIKGVLFFFEHLLNLISGYQILDATLSIGIDVKELSAAPYSLKSALQANQARIILGRNRIIFANELSKYNSEAFALTPYIENDQALGITNLETFKAFAYQDFEAIGQHLSRNPTQALEVFYSYVQKLIESVYLKTGEPNNLEECKASNFAKIKKIESIESFGLYLEGLNSRIYERIQQSKNSDIRLIQTIKKYIHDNYATKITLDDIANHVHMSSSYVGILFKKETGINYTDYLTQVRIENAKAYLKDIRYNISEVAMIVGYNDVKHFAKKFKSLVGVTPNEYKRIYEFY